LPLSAQKIFPELILDFNWCGKTWKYRMDVSFTSLDVIFLGAWSPAVHLTIDSGLAFCL